MSDVVNVLPETSWDFETEVIRLADYYVGQAMRPHAVVEFRDVISSLIDTQYIAGGVVQDRLGVPIDDRSDVLIEVCADPLRGRLVCTVDRDRSK